MHHFTWINWGWGLLSLVPMLPFDGGYVLLAIAERFLRSRGEQRIRLVSVGFALALAIAALVAHLAFPALLCGFIALQNARALSARETERHEILARVYASAAYEAATRNDHGLAIQHCDTVLRLSSVEATRKDGVRLLAYSYAVVGAWRPLLDLLESGGSLALDDEELEKYERTARELGRIEDARRIAMLRCPVPLQAM
jgi:hypothetical protein